LTACHAPLVAALKKRWAAKKAAAKKAPVKTAAKDAAVREPQKNASKSPKQPAPLLNEMSGRAPGLPPYT